jgi:hypothetical protein
MRISPAQISQFLAQRGWEETTLAKFPLLSTYTHPLFGDRQLFIPKNESASDYDDALDFLISKLALIERQEHYEIKRQLEKTDQGNTSNLQDRLALRIVKSLSDEESIPLSMANTVISESQTLLMVGSCMAENPQRYYRRIDNKISTDIYSRSVFNHTQRGSFIMSISCPILAKGEQLGFGLDFDKSTKSRQAFVSIYRGMEHLVRAVSEEKVNKFSDEVLNSTSPVVSSNFCEAVASIISKDSSEGMSVAFCWSPYIALPKDLGGSLQFFPSMADDIYRIAEALRPEEESLDDSFIGTVEALRGDVTSTGERAGAVEFLLFLKDGSTIRANAFLNIDQYRIADRAHIGGAKYIVIAGKLNPHPRVWVFESVRSFAEHVVQ